MICPSCNKLMKPGMIMDILSDQDHGLSDVVGRIQGYECDCGIKGCRTFKAIKHYDFYNVPKSHSKLEVPFDYTIRSFMKPRVRIRDGKEYVKL